MKFKTLNVGKVAQNYKNMGIHNWHLKIIKFSIQKQNREKEQ